MLASDVTDVSTCTTPGWQRSADIPETRSHLWVSVSFAVVLGLGFKHTEFFLTHLGRLRPKDITQPPRWLIPYLLKNCLWGCTLVDLLAGWEDPLPLTSHFKHKINFPLIYQSDHSIAAPTLLIFKSAIDLLLFRAVGSFCFVEDTSPGRNLLALCTGAIDEGFVFATVSCLAVVLSTFHVLHVVCGPLPFKGGRVFERASDSIP